MSPDIKFIKVFLKFKSKKFGELQFRRYNLNDLISIDKHLDKVSNNKKFVYKHLHNQLHSPKINFSKFQGITEQEIKKIAENFISKETDFFKYFIETTEEEFFKNFRKAIQEYKKDENKRFLESMEPIRKTIDSFRDQYSSLISQTLFPYDRLKEVTGFVQNLKETQLSVVESMKPFVEQARSAALMIDKIIKPQIEVWQNWAKENQSIFNSFRDYWKTFQEQYKITEKEAIKILREYKWFVTPSMPTVFVSEVVKIGKKRDNRSGEINKLFIDYFCSDDYRELESLVNGWNSNDIFKPRMKIIKDCIRGIRNARRGCNPSNFVLPPLIAQIDGVLQDYMEKNGLSFVNKKWTDSSGKKVEWKDFYRNLPLNQDLDELSKDIFIDLLFQTSYRGDKVGPPFFNRHKIMHGENIVYGRKDNTIRAFLVLDFLASLK
jgi:hypothetical protein